GAETSNAVMIVFMIVLPALILILGIVLWIRRRNR
ncbi:MAG: LPXTG cell wall anchor domain-containing protein, partial [Ruminococcus sp.]|nr:LPXTG cell wall anchor domain-containing protein [Ruminococcus sp.]